MNEEQDVRTYVRIPQPLRDLIFAKADTNRRSVTQEIIYRLERDAREHGEIEEAVAVG